MKDEKSLGQLELEVLKMVWSQPGSSVPRLTDRLLERKEYARTTILTVVQRLHKKGFLKRKKEDGAFRYYPTESKESVMSGLTKRFVKTAFDGSVASLIQNLTSAKLSADELTKMRDIIDQAIESEEGK